MTLEKTLELLSQRRVWAGISGTIAIVLQLLGANIDFDPASLTDAMMQLIQAIAAIAAIILPVASYFFPKKLADETTKPA